MFLAQFGTQVVELDLLLVVVEMVVAQLGIHQVKPILVVVLVVLGQLVLETAAQE
jgi:hypothetical protein